MNSTRPTLKKGATICFLATSGNIEEKENVLRAKSYFENFGYKIILSENIFDEDRYLAGSDEKKIRCLHRAFLNPEIDGIICARGGYGAIRLLDKINYDVIKNNKKVFCGYSDITALLAMFYKRAGLVGYHAPMAQGDFGVEKVSEFTVNSFFDAINGNELFFEGKNVIKSGTAEGILWGGNLSTLVSLCGLDFIPDEKFILFVEDIGEPVYKLDKMFTQLFNIEKFRKNIAGIAFGEFSNSDNATWLDLLIKEIATKINIPMINGFKITHGRDKITVPYGSLAEINTLPTGGKPCGITVKS